MPLLCRRGVSLRDAPSVAVSPWCRSGPRYQRARGNSRPLVHMRLPGPPVRMLSHNLRRQGVSARCRWTSFCTDGDGVTVHVGRCKPCHHFLYSGGAFARLYPVNPSSVRNYAAKPKRRPPRRGWFTLDIWELVSVPYSRLNAQGCKQGHGTVWGGVPVTGDFYAPGVRRGGRLSRRDSRSR